MTKKKFTRLERMPENLDELVSFAEFQMQNCVVLPMQNYELPHDLINDSVTILADTLKLFADGTHRLMTEGKIPKDRQYKVVP